MGLVLEAITASDNRIITDRLTDLREEEFKNPEELLQRNPYDQGNERLEPYAAALAHFATGARSLPNGVSNARFQRIRDQGTSRELQSIEDFVIGQGQLLEGLASASELRF